MNFFSHYSKGCEQEQDLKTRDITQGTNKRCNKVRYTIKKYNSLEGLDKRTPPKSFYITKV